MSSTVAWLGGASAAVLAGSGLTAVLLIRHFNKKVATHDSLASAIRDSDAALRASRSDERATDTRLQIARADLAAAEERTAELVALEARADEVRSLVEMEAEHRSKAEATELELHELKLEMDLYSRIEDLVSFGHYEEPAYLYETSERFSVEIKRVRRQQKDMITSGDAVDLPAGVVVDGTARAGKAILAGQAKLMLRAYNVEADALIGKVRPSNLQRTLERLEKNAEIIEKYSLSLECGISPAYVNLKYEECILQYQFRLRKEEEQAEQRLIREQMREEQRALREYEAAVAAADKEEQLYEKLLSKARSELAGIDEARRAEHQATIAALEAQLAEAHAKGERAKSLAEQTRRGHVYVISNVGSFGEDVFKIGLTRRLEPRDRVKELGDASVPFTFDVHAIIYADDAPAMETALHRYFDDRRVNAVNRRKEFFRVSLPEIQHAVAEITGSAVDFQTTVLAEEYFETLRLQG